MNIEWELNALLSEAIELLELSLPHVSGSNLCTRIDNFLTQYTEEFQNGGCSTSDSL